MVGVTVFPMGIVPLCSLFRNLCLQLIVFIVHQLATFGEHGFGNQMCQND